MIKVLLVEDQELVRCAVKKLLQDVSGIKVIGEAADGEEALRLSKELVPDIVLMDVKMPKTGGIESTRKMLRYNPDIKIIILTMYGYEPYPSLLLQAGASGYLTKGCSVEEMLRAIRHVHSGQSYLAPEIAHQLALKPFARGEICLLDALSEREMEIMLLITSGQKTNEIAITLSLSPKTVNSYRYRIFKKLGVNNDVALTLLNLRLKISEEANA